MNMKLLGITSYTNENKTELNTAYIKAFNQPNIRPIIIPTLEFGNGELLNDFDEEVHSFAKEYVTRLDGLVLSGGMDLHPLLIDEEFTYAVGPQIARDKIEIALLREAIKQNKPVMGICRGFQLIGQYFKLQVWQQTLDDSTEIHAGNIVKLRKRNDPCHGVQIRGSFLKFFRDKGKMKESDNWMPVNSWHHQGFTLRADGKPFYLADKKSNDKYWTAVKSRELSSNFNILAISFAVIEAIEHKELPIFGVQWHPEEYGPSSMTIKYFVDNILMRQKNEATATTAVAKV